MKAVRSVSLGRKILTGFFLVIIGFVILANIFIVGLSLEVIISKEMGEQNVVSVLNAFVLFFFLTEIMYRFFLQKISPMELENYLHLPIGRSKIIHFILGNSFISALNIIALLLFAPIAVTSISADYGMYGALSWLFSIAGISWILHWFILWFRQKYGDQLIPILVVFGLLIAGTTSAYYGVYNVGELLAPFLAASLHSFIPFFVTVGIGGLTYYLAFHHYRKHAYIEELGNRKSRRFINSSVAFFNRFGLAGEIADLELKLILRHKKSRMFLGMSFLFLLYGLLFYTDEAMISGSWISFFTVFIGLFITGMFMMNYGQLFLSWNSSHFDFYATRQQGIEALVKGKYLIFFGISLLCFILSIPYIYFGWEILFVHFAAFLFNIGVNIHIIIYLALWKPKPIDLNKGGLFNYEGMGAAQFLMFIPMFLIPYLVYLPFSLWGNNIAGMTAVGITGIIGALFYRQLIQIQINRILKNKYVISSSFRSEL